MPTLASSTQSIKVVLAGAVNTNELPITASWRDHPAQLPGSNQTVTNGATAVTAVPAPPDVAGIQRIVESLTVYNKDVATATVTVEQVDSAGNTSIIQKWTLETGETLTFDEEEGWQCFTTAGALKTTPSTDASASLSAGVSAGLAASTALSAATSLDTATDTAFSTGDSTVLSAATSFNTATATAYSSADSTVLSKATSLNTAASTATSTALSTAASTSTRISTDESKLASAGISGF